MLKEKLQQDFKESMRAGNASRKMTISLILNAIKNKELEKRTKLSRTEKDFTKLEEQSALTDDEISEVIASETKRRKESIESFEKGGRPELAAKEKEELAVLMEYMPEQLSAEAVRAEVQKTIKETGATSPKDMGKAIGAVMAKLKGKADGGTVSAMVKEELSK